jgi:hypothetical protein
MRDMSPAIARHTDLDQPLGFDRLRAPRGTGLITVLSAGAVLLGGPLVDQGTRIVERLDYRPMIDGTSLQNVHVEGPVVPFQTPTRMAQIRALAPLSLRDWGTVFGVSHSAIKQWVDGDEPDRDKLNRVLGALTEAAAHQPNLKGWLTATLARVPRRHPHAFRAGRDHRAGRAGAPPTRAGLLGGARAADHRRHRRMTRHGGGRRRTQGGGSALGARQPPT